MQDFDSLPDDDQAALLARLLNCLAADPTCRTIEDLAAQDGKTVNRYWADLCREVAVPECSVPNRLRGLDPRQ